MGAAEVSPQTSVNSVIRFPSVPADQGQRTERRGASIRFTTVEGGQQWLLPRRHPGLLLLEHLEHGGLVVILELGRCPCIASDLRGRGCCRARPVPAPAAEFNAHATGVTANLMPETPRRDSDQDRVTLMKPSG